MYKVLLTTSGIGSRLGDVTLYTNKSLVRVGDKPVLSHIVESYPSDIEFVVTVGHFAEHIEQFLPLAYPDRKFTFVHVDLYQGPGSSLAYSILQARGFIDCPFIFHACDTIVADKIPEPSSNWMGGAKKNRDSDHYVSFDVSGKSVLKIREKGEVGGDFDYIGLSGIKDFELFFQNLSAQHKKNTDSQLSDVSSLKLMLNDVEFESFECEWHDIGNVESLQLTREKMAGSLNVLDKNDESIFVVNDSVIKFFHNSEIAKNRVQRAEHLKGLVPNILDSSDNFYKYEFVEGSVLADCISTTNFKHFLEWSKTNLWSKKKAAGNFRQTCYDFYFTKTENRVNKFLTESGIKDIECTINGHVVPPVHEMMERISVDWLCGGEPHQFHGDFILDNTIKTKDGFMLVDWRQDFGGRLDCGDIYYDLAKMNHNLIFNHDIVSKDLYTLSNGKCDILRSHILVDCQSILHKFIKDNGYDTEKVKMLSAIIWLNMSPLHHRPLSNFLFYFGKLHLYQSLSAYDRSETRINADIS